MKTIFFISMHYLSKSGVRDAGLEDNVYNYS